MYSRVSRKNLLPICHFCQCEECKGTYLSQLSHSSRLSVDWFVFLFIQSDVYWSDCFSFLMCDCETLWQVDHLVFLFFPQWKTVNITNSSQSNVKVCISTAAYSDNVPLQLTDISSYCLMSHVFSLKKKKNYHFRPPLPESSMEKMKRFKRRITQSLRGSHTIDESLSELAEQMTIEENGLKDCGELLSVCKCWSV